MIKLLSINVNWLTKIRTQNGSQSRVKGAFIEDNMNVFHFRIHGK